ncbi:ubiquitin-specific protease 9 [Actinidia rufa]|uniref:Ubiquitin-specific protease 9 n=1 Tax=Actinidia rufa TaxID=165716 RepID=A0A7J0DYA4_9ERIC|nr:ubiquitin-specific protease 9 [Actinidia rufa]
MTENGGVGIPFTPEEEKRIVLELTNKAEANLEEGNLYYVVSNRCQTIEPVDLLAVVTSNNIGASENGMASKKAKDANQAQWAVVDYWSGAEIQFQKKRGEHRDRLFPITWRTPNSIAAFKTKGSTDALASCRA